MRGHAGSLAALGKHGIIFHSFFCPIVMSFLFSRWRKWCVRFRQPPSPPTTPFPSLFPFLLSILRLRLRLLFMRRIYVYDLHGMDSRCTVSCFRFGDYSTFYAHFCLTSFNHVSLSVSCFFFSFFFLGRCYFHLRLFFSSHRFFLFFCMRGFLGYLVIPAVANSGARALI